MILCPILYKYILLKLIDIPNQIVQKCIETLLIPKAST